MKTCPFCAEAIQDAAVVCKHCGRDVDAFDASLARVTPPRPRRVRSPFVVAAGLALVVGASITAGRVWGQAVAELLPAPAAAADGAPDAPEEPGGAGGTATVARREAPPPPPKPRVLELVDADAAAVGPEEWLHYGFTVGRGAPACRVAGRVLGLSGGNEDVEVYVLSADDYLNWRNNGRTPYTAAFSGPRQTATTLDVELPAAGEYHLVVSNRFSVATGKKVQARARVVCAPAGADGDAPADADAGDA